MTLPRYPQYKESGTSLGTVPSGWSALRLMRLASVNDDVLPESTDPDYEMEYVDIGSVSLDRGIERIERMIFVDAPSRARRLVRDGDILVSTVRTYLKAIAPVVSPSSNLVVSTGFAVVRPALGLLSGYGRYVLQATGFLDEVISRSTGVSYPAINASDLVRICVPVPPDTEQAAIATFLDRETAKIDALTTEQEKLIALLAEKRQATISYAVTRGLDPDTPMKDSGVAWLGEVPAHWKVVQLRRVVEAFEQGWSPECESRQIEGDEWGVLKAGCVNGGVFNADEHKALPPQLEPRASLAVQDGDVLMCRASGSPKLIGSVARLVDPPSRLMLSDKIFRLKLSPDIDSEFFVQAMGSMPLRAQIEQSIGGAQGLANNLPQSSIKEFWIAVPPPAEQAATAAHLAAEAEQVAALEQDIQRGIELLKERRSALIAAAVTGQIDVRDTVTA